MRRFFDVIIASVALVILLPLGLVIVLMVICESSGGAFFCQTRVGINGTPFKLYKFRTMFINSDQLGLLTIGNRDARITKIGYYLRKYKLDELPQLINILNGTMSFVGPRPEVQKYVDLYSEEQKKILAVRPGITDYASINYINENEILAQSDDKENAYIQEIMPEKIKMNMVFINNPSLYQYFKIIILTAKSVILHNAKS